MVDNSSTGDSEASDMTGTYQEITLPSDSEEGAPQPCDDTADSPAGTESGLHVSPVSQDGLLQHFLERERKLSRQEGSLIERQKQQSVLEERCRERDRQVDSRRAELDERERVIGDIEKSKKDHAAEGKRLGKLRRSLEAKEKDVDAKSKTLEERKRQLELEKSALGAKTKEFEAMKRKFQQIFET